jgi:formate dehydrogenase major subunit
MFTQSFGTADGKGHFQIVKQRPPAEAPCREFPYVLTTGRSIFHYHTASMTGRIDKLREEMPTGFVQIHPEDAATLGIMEGEQVVVRSRRGQIEVAATITADVPKGIVFVPFHFGGSAANVLTNPAYDPACRMPEFKLCSVNIAKRASPKA